MKSQFAGGGDAKQQLQPANNQRPPGLPPDNQPNHVPQKSMRKRQQKPDKR